MLKAIKINVVSKRLFFLYLLNIVDWFCTIVILKSGFFYEANPIMQPIINNIPISFVVKCVLPMALILFVSVKTVDLSENQEKFTRYMLNSVIAIYTVINLTHVINYYTLLFSIGG